MPKGKMFLLGRDPRRTCRKRRVLPGKEVCDLRGHYMWAWGRGEKE